MKKWSVCIIMALLVAVTATALQECKRTVEQEDIPCQVTGTWMYPSACTSYEAKVYNETGALQNTHILGSFGSSGFCNFTFNYTAKGSYTYNITSGDTGNILVEVKMQTIAAIIGLSLMAFLFLYFSFNLSPEHFLLKIMMIFFSLFTIILIPSVVINGVDGIKDTFLKIPLWLFGAFVTYFCVYLFWHWIKSSEKFLSIIDGIKGGFKK
jgi:hypothetical protein